MYKKYGNLMFDFYVNLLQAISVHESLMKIILVPDYAIGYLALKIFWALKISKSIEIFITYETLWSC